MKKISVFVLVFLSVALAGIFSFRHLFVPDQRTLGTVIENQVEDNSRNLSSEVISKSAEIFDETSSPLFVEQLNTIQIGGFKLGFWFAQQGSIYGFVAIIFTYIYWMNKLDKTKNK